MSNAEQVRRPHPDARAFAEAFSAADDAFSFAPSPGVSRTLTLSELQSALALETPVQLQPGRRAAADEAPTRLVSVPEHAYAEADDDGLLSLDELGAALARPAAPAEDGLDFDFGSGTKERARRRTAARLGRPDPGVSRTLRLVPAADTTVVRVLDEEGDWSDEPPAPAAPRAPRPVRRAPGPAQEIDESWFGPAAPAVPPREDGGMPARVLAALRPSAPASAPQPLSLPAAAAAASPELDRPREHRSLLAGLAARPDRIALWAVVLGILLVIIAASSSSQAAVRTHATAATAKPAAAKVQHVAATAARRLG